MVIVSNGISCVRVEEYTSLDYASFNIPFEHYKKGVMRYVFTTVRLHPFWSGDIHSGVVTSILEW